MCCSAAGWMSWILSAIVPVCSGWLLLAGPQSSSTATADQMANMAGVDATQEFGQCKHGSVYRRLDNGQSWPFYALRGHSDMCNGIESSIHKWADATNMIYKSHLPPTEKNIQYVVGQQKPVVFLTRNAQASTHGLCERMLEEHKLDPGNKILWDKPYRPFPTLEESEIAVQTWNDGWTHAASVHPDLFLHITFEDDTTLSQTPLGERLPGSRVVVLRPVCVSCLFFFDLFRCATHA